MVDTLAVRETRFGPYEIVRLLGRGGMGEVLEGRHAELGARVAIKVIRPSLAADRTTVRRLLREGRATAAIRHPNVVNVLDVGLESDRPYLVMEFLDGEDLAQRLKRDAPLTVEETVRMILPIISAVAAAHDAGIVHRDLKPSNVVLARRWGGIEPVVVDFGISKTLGATSDATSSSRAVAGTPQYMAPEQLRAPEEVAPAVDQYALGVLMYQCLTGGTPFWNEDYYELLHAIMTADLVDPSELNSAVPASLAAIVLRALARDPEARFRDVKALGAAILPHAAEEDQRRWRSELLPSLDPDSTFACSSGAIRSSAGTWRLTARACAVVAPVVLLGAIVVAQGRPEPARPRVLGVVSGAAVSAQTSILTPPTTPVVLEEATPPPPSVEAVVVRAHGDHSRAPVRPRSSVAPTPAPSESGAPSIERGTRNIPIVE